MPRRTLSSTLLTEPYRSTSPASLQFVTSTETPAAELRGWATRRMIAEDARWAMDLILSAQHLPKLSPYVALTLGHHFVRIAYEGATALRSANPYVGIPQLAVRCLIPSVLGT